MVIFSDSRTISYWISLELCSEKVARYLSYLGEFNLEIRYCPSTMQCDDVLSREVKGDEKLEIPVATRPPANIRIFNGKGKELKPEQLFSKDKRESQNAFFLKHKRGPLARLGGEHQNGNVPPNQP